MAISWDFRKLFEIATSPSAPRNDNVSRGWLLGKRNAEGGVPYGGYLREAERLAILSEVIETQGGGETAVFLFAYRGYHQHDGGDDEGQCLI